jgi:hypothetical protein
LDHLPIKFGEYNHQWNCGDGIYSSIQSTLLRTLIALPFPVPLLKNSSSAGKIGREPSMGMQYLMKKQVSYSKVLGVKYTKLHAADPSA